MQYLVACKSCDLHIPLTRHAGDVNEDESTLTAGQLVRVVCPFCGDEHLYAPTDLKRASHRVM